MVPTVTGLVFGKKISKKISICDFGRQTLLHIFYLATVFMTVAERRRL